MVQKGKKVQKVKRHKRKKVQKTVFFLSEDFYNQHRGANAYSHAVNPKKKFFLMVISPSVNLYLLYLFTFLYHFQYLPKKV
jgi:predicted ATPase